MIAAGVNSMNLTSARENKRAIEIGIKKSIGATRSQIAKQFFIEIFILNSFALIFAVIISELLFPLFANSANIELQTSIWSYPLTWVVLLSAVITGTLISGIYPAFILSSMKPALILDGAYLCCTCTES